MKKTSTPSLVPLGTRVLIKCPRTSDAEKSEQIVGGIVIPAQVQDSTAAALTETHMIVEVLAIGHDCERVKAGQRIVVLKRQCWVIKADGIDGEHTFVMENDIQAVLK